MGVGFGTLTRPPRCCGKAVFDVVVQDEIQLLRRESVVPSQHRVDFVDDRFGLLDLEGLGFGRASLLLFAHQHGAVFIQVF
jgi:hypothetical protein